MTIIIKCNDCNQEVVSDETKHTCNACKAAHSPQTWKQRCATDNKDSKENLWKP